MKKLHISRRYFLRSLSYSLLASNLDPIGGSILRNGKKSLIVRVHDAGASHPWDYHRSRPWNQSVEPVSLEDMRNTEFRSDRYYDHINEVVVASMLERGLKELTGAASAKEAWNNLLTNFKNTDHVTIKINLNNASYNEEITTNRMDQTIPLINAVISDLVEDCMFPEKNITVADPSRWIHPLILKERCKFKNINWVDSRSSDLWDHSETVKFTIDQPVRPENTSFPENVPFYLAKCIHKGRSHNKSLLIEKPRLRYHRRDEKPLRCPSPSFPEISSYGPGRQELYCRFVQCKQHQEQGPNQHL